jgi:hypothetical protein
LPKANRQSDFLFSPLLLAGARVATASTEETGMGTVVFCKPACYILSMGTTCSLAWRNEKMHRKRGGCRTISPLSLVKLRYRDEASPDRVGDVSSQVAGEKCRKMKIKRGKAIVAVTFCTSLW